MSDLTRDEIKAAVYAAVDETVDMVCTMIGIPDVDPVELKAAELYEAVNEGCTWAALIASDSAIDRQVRGEYRGVARLFVGQRPQR